MDTREALMEMLVKADKVGARNLLEQWGAEHGYERLIFDILDPTLKEIGEQWDKKEFSLSQAYIAAKLYEDIIAKIGVKKDKLQPDKGGKGPVVMGNIEDDFHGLGRRMVTTFLRADEWIVHDLGNDVLPSDFVDRALEVGARVIGASAMMYTTAQNIKALRTEIDRRGLAGKIQLAVGGAVFIIRPELVEEVGGDGTAKNALAAPSLFAKLWEQACYEG